MATPKNREDGVEQHLAGALRDVLFAAGQRDVGVQDAEDFHFGGMRVAFRAAAGGRIFDGVDDAKRALAIGKPIGAKICLMSEMRRALPGRRQSCAFMLLVHVFVHLGGIGGKTDAALIVDDADADHSGLVGHFRDDVVEAVALVAQHVVGGVALDDAAGAGGIGQSVSLQVRAGAS